VPVKARRNGRGRQRNTHTAAASAGVGTTQLSPVPGISSVSRVIVRCTFCKAKKASANLLHSAASLYWELRISCCMCNRCAPQSKGCMQAAGGAAIAGAPLLQGRRLYSCVQSGDEALCTSVKHMTPTKAVIGGMCAQFF
jgi:hypothetical protein